MKHLRGIPILKICMLLFSLLMLQPEEAEASHFRYGNITWERVAGNPYQIRFKVTQSWRLSAFNVNVGQTINPGTPVSTGVSNVNVNLVVTSVNLTEDWLYGEYTFVQTYPTTTANYTASFTSCCRIASPLVNNANGSFAVSTIVTVGNSNDAPVSTVPPFISLPVNTTSATYQLPVVDPNGDALTFSLTPNGQFGSGTVQPSGISISSSGLITFNTVGKTVGQFYNTSVYVTDSKGARIQIDVMIRITNPSTPPVFDYTVTPANNASYVLQPGQPLSFSVKASDTDPGASVTLSAVGVPPGATFSPTSGNPVTQAFSWTPTVANVGTYQVNFVAQDNVGIQTNSIVNIVVSQRPNFVAPSLVSGSILCYTPGQTITQTYTAKDVDTADRVRLSLATATQTGMSFSPTLPTTAANPTSTNFSWATTTANWGINTVVVRATDNYNETNDDTVFYIVNNPPLFATTQADVSITAGQLFSYTFSGTDANIAQGDVIGLSHTHYPSWMTIVNNNNGTWTISGTPSLSDSGHHHISLQLEDLTNHFRGTHCGSATQTFEVTVLPCNIITVPVAANVLCNGGATGSISLNVANATNPVSYAWSNSANTKNITGLVAGTYTVAITDANGCTDADTVVITEPTAIITSTTSTDNVCSTDNNGTIDLTVSGGITPYAYSWTNGGFTEDISSLYTGYYSVTVTDGNGCAVSASDTVFVTDNQLPLIVCPANISVRTDATACGAVVSYATPVGTDNCSGVTTTQTAGLASGATFPVGTTTNTFLATDANGNTATCSFTVTVIDSVAPIALCKNATVYLDGSGNASISVPDINNGSSDNCGIANISVSPTTFNCSNLGSNTVTLTVKDNSTISSGATVDQQNGPGNTPSGWGDVAQSFTAGTSGNLVGLEIKASYNFNSTATLAIYQGAGTSGTLLSTQTVNLPNAGGSTTQVVQYTLPTPVAITAGNVYSYALQNSFGIVLGVNTSGNTYAGGQVYNGGTNGGAPFNTWDFYFKTLMSTSGNTSTCTSTVTVSDTIRPVVVCPANISVTATTGQCGATVNFAANATDNCGAGGITYTYSQNPGTLFPVGTTTVTVTAKDASNNVSAPCSFTVTVADNEAPSITCPANVSVNNDLNACGAVVVYTTPVGTDNCSGATTTQTAGLASGSLFPIGTTTNTFKVTDANGNSTSCSFTVTVADNQNPTIANCSPNITKNVTTGQCGTNVSWTQAPLAPVVDQQLTAINIGTAGTDQWQSFTAGMNGLLTQIDLFHNGIQATAFTLTVYSGVGTGGAVLYTGNYNYGTFGSQWFGVQIPSGSQPVMVAGNTYTFRVQGSGLGFVSTFSSYGNYYSNSYGLNPCFSGGCWKLNFKTYVAVPGATTSANDNCGIDTFYSTHNSNDFFPVGVTPVTYTAKDIHGNTTTCSFNVTVVDNEAPVITCPANISVNNDANACGAVVSYSAPTSTDNCGVASTVQTAGLASGSTFPVGTTTNTFKVTDIHGNSSTCSFTVTVTDNVAPSITCAGNVSVNNDASVCGAVVNYATPSTSDNCGVASTVQTAGLASGSTFPVGTTTNTFVVTDVNGNTNTCSFTVTVADNEAPSITCASNISVNNDATVCGAVVNYAAPSTSDNCGIASTIQTAGLASGATFPVGTTTNTFKVTDVNGNTNTCSFTVTVVDNQAPVITCPANISVNNDATICGAVVNYAAPSATDNCGIASTVQTAGLASGSTFPVGTTTNTFKVTDVHGNSSTCSFSVTVVDNEAPVVVTQNQTVYLDANGNASTTANNINNNSTDNCGIQSVGLSQTTFNCSNVGANTVTLTVTDIYNNSASNTATVTVVDTVKPVITCPANVTVSCLTQPANTGTASATDACGIDTITYADASTYSANPADAAHYNYTISRTWTVVDNNGNSSSCTQTITVQQLNTTAQVTNVACNGGNSGSIDLSVAGGVGSLSYSWSNGATTQDVNGLVAGTYSVVVTDGAGCTQSTSYTVAEPTILVASAIGVSPNPTVAGQSMNTIYLGYGAQSVTLSSTASGGTPGYTYSWTPTTGVASPTSATTSVSPVVTTTYTLTVTDVNGCIRTVSKTIYVMDVRDGNNKVKLCHNGHTISVSVNSVPSHLAHGDQLGKCFEVDANTTKVSCYGGNNGSINATVTGGVPPYTYSWSNGATTEDISGLTAGNYTLTVTAANGAITSGTFTVSQNSKININGSVTHVKCHGESTGKINLSVSGGDNPYNYVWNDASTSKNRSNLAAGTYIVTVTDSKGCTMKDTFVITQPATPISVTSVITHVKCYGSSTGKIDITVTGGTGPYNYNWSQGNSNSDDDDDYGDDDDNNNNDDDDNGDDDNGDDDDNNNYGDDDDGGNCNTQDNVNLKAGTYTVKVKDANGCEKIVTFTILQPTAITGTIAVNPNPTVAGQSHNTIFRGYGPQSVTLTASASGGTPGYTYSWSPTSGVGSPTSASTTVTPTNTTTYKVTITDANGCKKELTKKIEVEDVRSGGNKIKLCHNGNTISVSQSSVAAHLAHGDNLGSCNSGCKDCKDPKEEANQDAHEESMVSDIAVTYEMKVYPNPNNGMFEVKLPSKDEAIIIISNVSGQVVYKNVVSDKETLSIDMSSNAKGIYMMQLTSGGATYRAKVNIQ